MKLRYCIFIMIGFLAFNIIACVDAPNYNNTPAITEIEVIQEKNVLQQLVDSLTLVIHFEDGDGDLGLDLADLSISPNGPCCTVIEDVCTVDDVANDAEFCCTFGTAECLGLPNYNIFIKDVRTGFITPGAFPVIPPRGNVDDISGTIEYKVFSGLVCCAPPVVPFKCASAAGVIDTLRFSVQIYDRAGNFSNEMVSQPILISCD